MWLPANSPWCTRLVVDWIISLCGPQGHGSSTRCVAGHPCDTFTHEEGIYRASQRIMEEGIEGSLTTSHSLSLVQALAAVIRPQYTHRHAGVVYGIQVEEGEDVTSERCKEEKKNVRFVSCLHLFACAAALCLTEPCPCSLYSSCPLPLTMVSVHFKPPDFSPQTHPSIAHTLIVQEHMHYASTWCTHTEAASYMKPTSPTKVWL
ncbi:hypothetical protein BDQ17DRAFT_1366004 [Cyathus striatus]|nr:hypothetical protein BDQ17DRAFT_1366004 [Cyathus striatus]